ncbi:MAG: hypothetical protein OHK0021_07830 [Bryobacter sp.]
MRAACVLALTFAICSFPQETQGELDRAYLALRGGQLEQAADLFQSGLKKQPDHAGARIDYAYLLLRLGQTVEAREEIRIALEQEPEREALWLEYAFLCFETNQRPQGYEVFLRLRNAQDEAVRKSASEAFARIDQTLKTAIERWRREARENGGSYSVHEELARLLEERNDWVGAAEHYRIAFGLRPEKRSYLLDIARVEREALRVDYAMAALLAASRGANAWVAEQARERMTQRYPYVYEFQYAIQMDPMNVPLRRELGFLHLAMKEEREALRVFEELLRLAPEDELALAQVAFLKGSREMLAKVAAKGESNLSAVRELAKKSMEKGYLKDALEYLTQVQKADPQDYEAMLRLGWTHNMLKNDREAIKWFQLARQSSDPKVAKEADEAYRNLRPALAPFQTTSWVLPFYSSRWKEVFTYGQTKMEFRIPGLGVRPYLSSRLIADWGRNRSLVAGPGGALGPQSLSEGAVVAAVGVATPRRHGLMAWGEAGSAWRYFSRSEGGARIKPDYRAGVNFAKSFGEGGWWSTTFDAVFLSRFDNNTLFYSQNRIGQTRADGPLRFYWNVNLTMDAKRQDWANFVETGPGLRLQIAPLPKGLYFSVDYLEGWHLLPTAPGRARRFRDLRAGLWYAFTR